VSNLRFKMKFQCILLTVFTLFWSKINAEIIVCNAFPNRIIELEKIFKGKPLLYDSSLGLQFTVRIQSNVKQLLTIAV